MPATQVRGGDYDDEPTFPTAKEPFRRPTQNPRINPKTGLPHTSEAKKQAMKEIMERRYGEKKKGDDSESSSEEEEETPKK